MTDLLRQAFDEIAKLDGAEQDSVALWLLQELAAERRWNRAIGESEGKLATLADEALREHRAGQTSSLDPDAL